MDNARAVQQAMRWALWRLDDNGNRFVVAVFAHRDEAEATARAFETHGHKQSYWVEKMEGDEDPVVGKSGATD